MLTVSAMAADISLTWDPSPGATGYMIAMSTDMGATWQTPIDVKLVRPYAYLNVPEDKMLIFKAGAYNSTGVTAWNNYAFAAYDHRHRLAPPTGFGIK
jgi:hypothetical protein